MKVIINCAIIKYHKDHCYNIVREIERRGGEVIITPSAFHIDGNICKRKGLPSWQDIEKEYAQKYSHFDCTIAFDEHNHRIAPGPNIFVNHGIPISPQADYYLHNPQKKYRHRLRENMDYIFTFSKVHRDYYEEFTGIPTIDTGFTVLDSLLKPREDRFVDKIILYAPTHFSRTNVSCDSRINTTLLKEYCESKGYRLITKAHPMNIQYQKRAGDDDEPNSTTWDVLKKACIVITDYSSIGYSALALDVPTIFIDSPYWNARKQNYTHPMELMTENVRNAAIRCLTQADVHAGIERYIENNNLFAPERENVKYQISSKIGDSSKKFVDELEKIINKENSTD